MAGRPLNVKDENHMFDLWASYKDSLIKQAEQWPKIQYVGRDGVKVTDYPKIPPTLDGFKRYCREIGIGYVHQYFDNVDNAYERFLVVCTCIRDEIKEDHTIGGLLGFYNPSITQRLHGMTEKTESTITTIEPRIFKID